MLDHRRLDRDPADEVFASPPASFCYWSCVPPEPYFVHKARILQPLFGWVSSRYFITQPN
jgi:hypothetical protein